MSTEDKLLRRMQNEALDEIIKNYKKYKLRLLKKNSLSEGVRMRYIKYLKKVDQCINKLAPTVKIVFRNAYLINNEDFRIFGFYSMSQFYRLKNKGRDEFLLRFSRRASYEAV